MDNRAEAPAGEKRHDIFLFRMTISEGDDSYYRLRMGIFE